jgi:ATP phosphoribosyltransferase regulatory subunit HisZ
MTSNDNDHRGLLPAGLADLLPPDAAREARAIDVAIERFAAFGYERVKPPLVEFEESLLGGPGAALASQTFRLMDPVSQRMMGVRPDMTVQVARIAVTRLKHEPRPLRLSYGGNVIRVRGSALKPERQFAQVGTELIGVDSAEADAEAVLLAVDTLRAIGVSDLTVDLNLPTLVAAVANGLNQPAEALNRLRRALDRKDEGGIAKASDDKKVADLFAGLLRAAGPADKGSGRRPVGRRGQGQDRRLAVASAPTSWCASRAATMPAIRWSSTARPTSWRCCPRAWCGRASSRSSATASWSIPGASREIEAARAGRAITPDNLRIAENAR